MVHPACWATHRLATHVLPIASKSTTAAQQSQPSIAAADQRARRTVAYMVSGLKRLPAVCATLASTQYVHAAMNGMYRSGEFTSCRGGRYLCPPAICRRRAVSHAYVCSAPSPAKNEQAGQRGQLQKQPARRCECMQAGHVPDSDDPIR